MASKPNFRYPSLSLSSGNRLFLHDLVIIHHHHYHPSRLGLYRPVSASSNKLFIGLQRSPKSSSSIPSTIQHSFPPPAAVHTVTCRSQSVLYLLSFSSAGSALNSSKTSSFHFWGKKGGSGCSSEEIPSQFMSAFSPP